MIHVCNRFHFRQKVFLYCFFCLMTFFLIKDYHSIYYNREWKQTEHDIQTSQVQSENISREVKIVTLSANSEVLQQTLIAQEQINNSIDEVIEIETKKLENPVVEEERQNKLYYISDQGFSYELPYEYQDYLYAMCIEYGIPEHYELLLAQMYHESKFDSDVISSTQDYGLMQINKCNHLWLKEKLGIKDFLNPYDSIKSGVFMMSQFLSKYDDVQKALVCYNKGEKEVINGTYTTSYSKGVLIDQTKLVEVTKERRALQ